METSLSAQAGAQPKLFVYTIMYDAPGAEGLWLIQRYDHIAERLDPVHPWWLGDPGSLEEARAALPKEDGRLTRCDRSVLDPPHVQEIWV